jgi:hypothetical protein
MQPRAGGPYLGKAGPGRSAAERPGAGLHRASRADSQPPLPERSWRVRRSGSCASFDTRAGVGFARLAVLGLPLCSPGVSWRHARAPGRLRPWWLREFSVWPRLWCPATSGAHCDPLAGGPGDLGAARPLGGYLCRRPGRDLSLESSIRRHPAVVRCSGGAPPEDPDGEGGESGGEGDQDDG